MDKHFAVLYSTDISSLYLYFNTYTLIKKNNELYSNCIIAII